jgi:hypothetical protein
MVNFIILILIYQISFQSLMSFVMMNSLLINLLTTKIEFRFFFNSILSSNKFVIGISPLPSAVFFTTMPLFSREEKISAVFFHYQTIHKQLFHLLLPVF